VICLRLTRGRRRRRWLAWASMSMRCGLQTLLEAARFVELQEEFEKQQLVTLHAAEEPLSNSKDAGYHPTSVTLPSSDLPASLNHIEPPSTPPRLLLQQPPPPPLPPPPPQQQAAPVLLQQQHHVYKSAVVATAAAANNHNSVVSVVNNQDENVAALSLAQELKRRTGSGTREVHNKLEKNRRAHLKECFELLKKQVPASQDEKKTSNLSILRSAIRYIQVLRRRERELEHEMERLAREKIWAQQRHASLKKELAAKWDHIDFSKLLPDLPPDVMTRKTTIATSISINGDFETERDASMVTSDADDSKLSALYSSTSSLSSSSPPTLPLVSDITPHQVQVVSTSPMMGSTIHIVPQTRNSSSLPPNTLQQTLTFVHHKDALNQQDGTTQAVLTKVSNGSFTLYGDPKNTPNRSKVSLAGIKIGQSVIDHSNTASTPIRLLQNNIISAQSSVVNRGQPTPNHVITRPLLLTHHHTNSSPAHLVLSTASSKAVTIPSQQLPPLSNGHLLVKPSAMVVMNSSQPKSHHSGHKA